jgi:hypothetical protein
MWSSAGGGDRWIAPARRHAARSRELRSLQTRDSPAFGLYQVLARAAGPYERDFRARIDDPRSALTENDVSSESQELAAGVVSASPDKFTALLQGDALVKNGAAPEGRVNTYRIKADLVRDGGVWKLRSLEFVE